MTSQLLIGVLVISILVLVGTIIQKEKKFKNALKLKELLHKEQVEKAKRDSKKRSSSVQWGLTIENFAPFTSQFPIPVESVTFLGKPIDYVGYTDTDNPDKCAVHFVEVKSGRSQLLKHQRNIKNAIKAGRVNWHEVRVDANPV